MKYRKRDALVDAWETTDLINRYISLGVEGLPEPIGDAYENGLLDFPTGSITGRRPERVDIISPLGMMTAPHGTMLVLDNHHFYPVRPDVFRHDFMPLDPPKPMYPYTINESR